MHYNIIVTLSLLTQILLAFDLFLDTITFILLIKVFVLLVFDK